MADPILLLEDWDEFIRLFVYKTTIGVQKSNEYCLCQMPIGEANALEISATLVTQIDATSRVNATNDGATVSNREDDPFTDLESTDPVTESTDTTQVSSSSGSNNTQTVREWEDLS